MLVVAGEVLRYAVAAEIRARLGDGVYVAIHIAEGLEYYPLKNHGARHASGDLLLFVDSDVWPDDDWLPHLLGSFARTDVDVVCGQTYVAPTDLVARAFALGWRYPLRDDDSGSLHPLPRFYCNSIAFRSTVFPPTGFPSLGRRSRGAATLLGQALGRQGIGVWENPRACVDHPPPAPSTPWRSAPSPTARSLLQARRRSSPRCLAFSQMEALRHEPGRVSRRALRARVG